MLKKSFEAYKIYKNWEMRAGSRYCMFCPGII